jgi:hypothetical protein
MLSIDHVICVTSDLESAAARLLDEHGLSSIPGGRHTGHGTGNRIVPLGDTYIELMAVVDPDEAAHSELGRWAGAHARTGVVPLAICLRTDDIDAIAEALGDTPEAMTRERSDGAVLSWRLVGLRSMLGPGTRPFFIQWDVAPGDHPGAATVTHRSDVAGIQRVEMGPVGELSDLIGDVGGLFIEPGPPGVHRIVISAAGGPITLSRS